MAFFIIVFESLNHVVKLFSCLIVLNDSLDKLSTCTCQERLDREASQFKSIFFTKDTVAEAKKASASLCGLVEQVVRGQLNNGFAVIRPPGHHAEPGLAGGYCVINNVAVVAAYATAKLGMNRILIVDWVSNEYIFASRFAGSSLIFKLSIVFWLLFAGFFA